MSDKPRILLVCDSSDRHDVMVDRLGGAYEITEVDSPLDALSQMARQPFDGIFVDGDHLAEAFQMERLVQSERILEGMPDGVVLIDVENVIIWGNGRLREWSGQESVVGENFYKVMGSPEILGPDFCPFHTALATGLPSSSTLFPVNIRSSITLIVP